MTGHFWKAGLLACCAWFFALLPAEAQRAVSVNGYWLTPEELLLADRNAGFMLPNGHYWCDPASGLWGQAGGTAMGRVDPSQCPPLPGQSAGQPYLRSGPGGTIGSDGSCSYYNDPQTGASVMIGNC